MLKDRFFKMTDPTDPSRPIRKKNWGVAPPAKNMFIYIFIIFFLLPLVTPPGGESILNDDHPYDLIRYPRSDQIGFIRPHTA